MTTHVQVLGKAPLLGGEAGAAAAMQRFAVRMLRDLPMSQTCHSDLPTRTASQRRDSPLGSSMAGQRTRSSDSGFAS